MLTVRDLVAGYQRDIRILQGVTLVAEAGRVTVLIGANGAGKSTLLKTISGFLRPSAGSIELAGEDLGEMAPHGMVLRKVAYVPQGHSLFPHMSVRENLELGCWAFRKERTRVRRAMEQGLGRFPMLAERLDQRAGNLSGGLQRILEIARALLPDPKVLLLDEPTVGLAPLVAGFIYETVARLAHEEGLTVLLVDQNVRMAVEIADWVYELAMGRVTRKLSGEQARARLDTLAQEWLI